MRGYMQITQPDGISTALVIERPPSLDDLQRWVGGYIEHVPYYSTTESGHPCVAFCNENGKLENLPRNEVATAMWRSAFKREMGDALSLDDYLAGTVVVLMGDDEFMKALAEDDEDA